MADYSPRGLLAAHLGDGTRSESFEQFLTFARDLRVAHEGAPEDAQLIVRFAELVSVACVEGATQVLPPEEMSGPKVAEVINAMCVGASLALTCAVLSVLRDETPASVLRAIVSKSFEAGLEQTIASNGLKG